jgi:hypothetical protein
VALGDDLGLLVALGNVIGLLVALGNDFGLLVTSAMILASFGLFVAIGKAFQTWALNCC